MAYAELASPRAWARWAASVGAYAVVAALEATLGYDTRATADATYVAAGLVASVGLQRCGGPGQTRRHDVASAVVYSLLALPVWVIASGSTDVGAMALDGGRAVATVAAWAVVIAGAPVVGPCVAGLSLLLGVLPQTRPLAETVEWASAPAAFAAGPATTMTHIGALLFGLAAGAGWTRARAAVIRT